MLTGERIEIALHGIRWANYILTEILGNHGDAVGPRARSLLQGVTRLLVEAQDEIRDKIRRPGGGAGRDDVPEDGGGR